MGVQGLVACVVLRVPIQPILAKHSSYRGTMRSGSLANTLGHPTISGDSRKPIRTSTHFWMNRGKRSINPILPLMLL